jgi:(p)ppGpp synthase/HD superfamily hydrolase
MHLKELSAKRFATAYHGATSQTRKYTGEPYIVHPEAVAEYIRTVAPDDINLLCAAWLHDIVEDTVVTIETIVMKFGPDVGNLVAAVTNTKHNKKLPRKDKFAVNLNYLSRMSPRAQTLKLADIIHNTSNLMEYDPEFATEVYFPEKRLVLGKLTEGNEVLFNLAVDILYK